MYMYTVTLYTPVRFNKLHRLPKHPLNSPNELLFQEMMRWTSKQIFLQLNVTKKYTETHKRTYNVLYNISITYEYQKLSIIYIGAWNLILLTIASKIFGMHHHKYTLFCVAIDFF